MLGNVKSLLAAHMKPTKVSDHQTLPSAQYPWGLVIVTPSTTPSENYWFRTREAAEAYARILFNFAKTLAGKDLGINHEHYALAQSCRHSLTWWRDVVHVSLDPSTGRKSNTERWNRRKP